MRSLQNIICLIFLISSINCYTEIDKITISVKTNLELTQDGLKNASSSALSWSNEANEFYSCTNLSNKYYSTINNTFTLEKNFTNLSTHDYVYITFDTVFLNVQKVNIGIEKHAQIEIDGQQYTFSAFVVDEYFGCMQQTTSSKRDGDGNAAILLSHNTSSMSIKIKALDLGTVARLGIANMKIITADCGQNTTFNVNTLQCECKSGYKVYKQSHGSPGHIYYEKICVPN